LTKRQLAAALISTFCGGLVYIGLQVIGDEGKLGSWPAIGFAFTAALVAYGIGYKEGRDS
jgi:hypothetical protein